MGKGDIKSKRGKIHNGSYGVRRMRKKSSSAVSNVTAKAAKGKSGSKSKAAKKA